MIRFCLSLLWLCYHNSTTLFCRVCEDDSDQVVLKFLHDLSSHQPFECFWWLYSGQCWLLTASISWLIECYARTENSTNKKSIIKVANFTIINERYWSTAVGVKNWLKSFNFEKGLLLICSVIFFVI